METDPEVSGNGNSYTTEFRQYDPRLGRWKSLDPLMAQFPWQSPYCAFDNNPIFYIDPYGLSSGGSGGEPTPVDLADYGTSYDFGTPGEGLVMELEKITVQYHIGSDEFEEGWYSKQDYALITQKLNSIKETAQIVDNVGSNANHGVNLLKYGVEKRSGITEGSPYKVKGGETRNYYVYDTQLEKNKKLYSTGSGEIKQRYSYGDRKGYIPATGAVDKLDNLKKLGKIAQKADVPYVGEILDGIDLGTTAAEHGWTSKPVVKKAGEIAYDMVADGALTVGLSTGNPVLIGGGLLMKGGKLLYELFSAPKGVYRGPYLPPPVDIKLEMDTNAPWKINPDYFKYGMGY